MTEKMAHKYTEGNTIASVPKSTEKFRNYCFTCFDEFKFEASGGFDKQVKYCIVGKEICPETKREHWQCFIIFKNGRTFTACQKFLWKFCVKKPHVEICKGTPLENVNYCKKDKLFKTFGEEPVGQGARVDLEFLKDEIVKGVPLDSIAMEYPNKYHAFGRTLSKIEDIIFRKKFRTHMTTGVWIYGKTGVGKSHKAFQDFTPETHYLYPNDGGWWDGYTGQEIVIFNDFRGEVLYKELLELCDKWPKVVRRRCREPAPFLAKKIIVTSSLHPKNVYHNIHRNDNLDQMIGRRGVNGELPPRFEVELIGEEPANKQCKMDFISDELD